VTILKRFYLIGVGDAVLVDQPPDLSVIFDKFIFKTAYTAVIYAEDTYAQSEGS
jgi:hypothetical protein